MTFVDNERMVDQIDYKHIKQFQRRIKWFRLAFYIFMIITVLSLSYYNINVRNKVDVLNGTITSVSNNVDVPYFSNSKNNKCNNMLEIPKNERCQYVIKHCLNENEGFILYNEIYYCHINGYPIISLFFFLLVTSYIFMVISITSGEFFCPNLSNMVDWLQLPESIAGITLAAFGNGAPDLFGTFTALNADLPGLAIGELLGAAMVLSLACAGSVAIIRPFYVRGAIIREITCFIGALLILMYIAYRKEITLYNGLAMMAFYFSYVSIMIYLEYSKRRELAEIERNKIIPPDIVLDSPQDVWESPLNTLPIQFPISQIDISMDTRDSLSTRSTPSLTSSDMNNSEEDNRHNIEVPSSRNSTTLRRGHSQEFSDSRTSLGDPARTRSSSRHSRAVSMDLRLDFGRHSELRGSRRSSVSDIHSEPIDNLDITTSNAANDHIEDEPFFINPRIIIPKQSILRASAITPYSPGGFRPHSPTRTLDNDSQYRDYFSIPLSRNASGRTSPVREIVTEPYIHTERGASSLGVDVLDHITDDEINSASICSTHTSIENLNDLGTEEDKSEYKSGIKILRDMNLTGLDYLIYRYFPVVVNWDYIDLITKIRGILLTPFLLILLCTIPVVHIDDTINGFRELDVYQSALQILLLPPMAWLLLSPDNVRFSSMYIVQDFSIFPDVKVHIITIFIASGLVLSLLLLILTVKRSKLPFHHNYTNYVRLPEEISNFDGSNENNEIEDNLSSRLDTDETSFNIPHKSVHAHDNDSSMVDISYFSKPLVICGFISSMIWIYTFANEIVSLFKTLVGITGISQTVLGLTLLAIGSSVGDFVTNTSIAAMGYPNMAFSACYGSPMLNLVLGVGFTATYIIVVKNIPQYYMGNDMVVIQWCSAILVVLMLILCCVLRFKTKFYISAYFGWVMIFLWITIVTGVILFSSVF